jgi:hypothetical protein
MKGRDHPENLDINRKVMDRREIGSEGVNWIHLAQEPVAGSCEHNPSGCMRAGNFLSS